MNHPPAKDRRPNVSIPVLVATDAISLHRVHRVLSPVALGAQASWTSEPAVVHCFRVQLLSPFIGGTMLTFLRALRFLPVFLLACSMHLRAQDMPLRVEAVR